MAGGAALGGALIGGILGGVGGIISARDQKKAFRKFRRRQNAAIQQARDFADTRVEELTGEGSLIGRGIDFLKGTFDNPEDSPLADQLRKSIRVSQESRGIRRSVTGAVAEARALGGFTQNLRASLLPQLQSFGTVGENLRQSIISFEAPLRIGAATGLNVAGLGPAPGLGGAFAGASSLAAGFSGFTSGGIGGAQIGQGFANSQQNSAFLQQLQAQGQN